MRSRRTVLVGVVRKPFGLRGDLFVHPDPDLAEDFPPGRSYRVEPAEGLPATLTVASTMVHRGLRIVRFVGYEDRDAAADLYGAVLRRDALPTDVDADTVWSDDLLGRAVVDQSGAPVGTLTGVGDGAAHDYLVVTVIPGLLDDGET